jgi:molecular chaperone DnaK
MGKVIGIDLGTTNSVVAIMEGGKPNVIANAEGLRTTPSIVAYTKRKELLVGQNAKRQAVINPENTFFSVKRFIGSKINEIDEESKELPYKIFSDTKSNIKIKCNNLDTEFSPEEISAQILKKLVKDASTYLGQPITQAVITVPAYFNDSQRQATKDAGKIAGIDVLRIINEPTAASLAYGLDKKTNETILVFDLGGGTFDVSVLEVGDGVFEVLSTSGDTNLGGDNFDKVLVNWLIDNFKKEENVDLSKDPQALQRITEAAEKAKIELSNVMETTISIPFITATNTGPKHIEKSLSRAKFENLCNNLINRCKNPVEKAIRDAKISKNEINEVVLVGGSTRIPAIKNLVEELTNKKPNQTVNPDEVVAIGAAIQAGVLSGEVKDILLLDVTPLSLGVETLGGIMTKIITRNTTVPIKKSETFSTSTDNQNSVEIEVLQGERELAQDNKSLGLFKLDGIPNAPRGIPQINVTFDIDVNGILSVSAEDKSTGKKQSITIKGSSNLDKEEIEEMVNIAEKYSKEDIEKREIIEEKNKIDSFCYKSEKLLNDFQDKINKKGSSCIKKRDEAFEFINKIRNEIKSNTSIQTLKNYYSELESLMKSIEDIINTSEENNSDDSSLKNDDSVIDV